MSLLPERSRQTCRICGIKKDKIRVGRYPTEQKFKYVDETGGQWNGRRCPKCSGTLQQKSGEMKRFIV